MKAVYISEYGGPDKLVYGDAPEPQIGREQVLVRVRACALNRREMFVREGSHGTRTSLPLVLGMEGAGEVVQVGDGVPNFRVGDRVLGGMPGAYAEYARSHYMDLYPIPNGMSFEEASSIYVSFATAWHLLMCKARIAMGQDVLVMAGGSGVGIAAIQIAKLASCRVLTTAGTDEKLQKAERMGADAGINYKTEDMAARVRELTDGQGVDVVLDHIGASVWEQCFASIKTGRDIHQLRRVGGIPGGVSPGPAVDEGAYHIGISNEAQGGHARNPASVRQGRPEAGCRPRLPPGGGQPSPPGHGGVGLLWQGGAERIGAGAETQSSPSSTVCA